MQQGLQIAKVKMLQYGGRGFFPPLLGEGMKDIEEQFLKLVTELYFKGFTFREAIEMANEVYLKER